MASRFRLVDVMTRISGELQSRANLDSPFLHLADNLITFLADGSVGTGDFLLPLQRTVRSWQTLGVIGLLSGSFGPTAHHGHE